MLLSLKRTFCSPNYNSLFGKSMRYVATTSRSTQIQEYQATLAVDCENILGECPIWDFRRELLCWIDIEAATFWTYNPINKDSQCYQLPERSGSFALCDHNKFDKDTYLIAFETGPAFYNISSGKMIGDRIFECDPNRKKTRTNDGRVDRQGRFVFGEQEEPFDDVTPRLDTSVYRINTDLSYDILLDGIGCANSLCWSKNGKIMYFTDTLGMGQTKHSIFKYDYFEDNRKPNNRQIFAVYDSNNPDLNMKDEELCYVDGSIVDDEDAVWNAGVRSGRVWRFDKEGNIDNVVRVPEPWVTCATFGGKDLDTMYITTLNWGSESEFMTGAEKGGLYQVKLPIKGCRENVFLGG